MKKYNYLNVIQQNYGGYGWEDVSEYDSDSAGNDKSHVEKMEQVTTKIGSFRLRKVTLLQHDLKEYRLTGYPTRVIKRRELNTNN